MALQPSWQTTIPTPNENIAAIKSWLRDCRENKANIHVDCQPVPCTPRRLIHTGLDGTPPRLVHGRTVTVDSGGGADYATLSHCWGGGKLPLQTTRETLGQFSEAIPAELLPKTFSDALQIARELRIPHIWIDALCIVQDDNQEWQAEAVRMDSIYRGSQFTIAASQSKDSSGGCFSDRGGLWDGSSGNMFFRTTITCGPNEKSNDLIVRLYKDDIRGRAEHNILSTRGWTLQEQLLSTRLVSCMTPEILWSCQGVYQTQGGLHFPRQEAARFSLLHSTKAHNGLPRAEAEEIVRRGWWRLVNNYSGRRFTFPSDRVAAMAGTVRYVGEQLGDDDSILGLWKKSFARDLGWLRLSNEPDQKLLPLADSLPSWSWLACPGTAINAFDFWNDWGDTTAAEDTVRNHLELLDWKVEWDGMPYTSTLKKHHAAAYVRVEAPVCEISITPFPDGDLSNPPYYQVFGESLTFPDDDSKKTTNIPIPWRCAGQFDSTKITDSGTYLCLLLRSRTRTEKVWADRRLAEMFLIVEPVGEQQQQQQDAAATKYKRIGLGLIYAQDPDAPTFDLERKMCVTLV
ncbi:heterokaryon incompatibility protein-domain-containing protein [Apodospora peruviana]|uniref:Heterokaryon incompatibility protein-domain-containing protein n=1 Tax=Apodospora peruviana TaxID=516989 RepID=A0AAE0MD66_9PEZI|nr:heterokaryon incompatibility protein-domain-containing protein [Apodospora peruviana]